MPKFKVKLHEIRKFSALVEVEADNEDDAAEFAWDEFIGDWEDEGTIDSEAFVVEKIAPKITGIKPVPSDIQNKADKLLAGLKKEE